MGRKMNVVRSRYSWMSNGNDILVQKYLVIKRNDLSS